MTYVVWDVETTIRTSYKRKANPFDKENYVVMSGYKRAGGDVFGDYFGRAGCLGGAGLPQDWFTKLLSGHKLLVGQNIKFDLLYALREPQNLSAWMDWVADGGTVWDTQLAEYLLEGMAPTEHMLSMDELAPRYGGNLKFDEVKALWNAGVSTEEIDPDLLRRYLCGTATDHGDIGNTEMIFKGQLDRARACGQVKSILLNMGSLLCTVEMERNGMAVNIEEGRKQGAELELEIAKVSIELSQYLPADLPFDFKWSSSIQKSAIIFGGEVTYQKRIHLEDEDGNKLYAMMDEDQYVLEEGGCINMQEWHSASPVPPPNLAYYKGGKNAGEAKTKKVKVPDPLKPKMKWTDFQYTFKGHTQPKPRWEGATPGVFSVNAAIIEELSSRKIPFLKALAKVSSLTKDLTTYFIMVDPETGEEKGMLTLVQADGIIHHMLNHTSTVTARFSSSNPNLQNLPKGNKSNVKALFISRFKGGKIIQSDFSSLEVYVQAILTNCLQLIEDLKAGLDMHCVRVSQKEGIDYEVALLKCKGNETTEPIPEWSMKRTKAKTFSFERAYGAGAKSISEGNDIPLDEVEALIAAEEARYPEVTQYYADLTVAINENSEPTNKWDQHPDIPGLTCNFRKSYYRTPDNKLYTWRQKAAPEWLAKRPASKGGKTTSFSPTEIKNYPVQGTGGEWAKAAMWLAVKAYYKKGNFNMGALLVNQVHDALYTDAKDEVALEAAALLHACMEEASVLMEQYFAWTIPVPVPSDTNWGKDMLEEGRMPDNFKPLVAQYRTWVRSTFLNNYQPSFEQLALAA
jgi:DNA polymerase-1